MTDRNPEPSLVTWTHVMYGLHALAAFIGITSPATVVGKFLFGVPSIMAIIMNYLRGAEATGTWLESHFTWQRRTFWYAALWSVLAFVASLPLFVVFIGFFTFALAVAVIGLWLIYRVARGWLALNNGKPVFPLTA